MKENSGLLALNCPNCQAPLECDESEMTVTCESCGTSVLIKDLVTKTRINKGDKLKSSVQMAENAFDNKDWKSACKFYEQICKTDYSAENMAVYNLLMYINGKISFNGDLITNSKNIEPVKRRLLLELAKNALINDRTNEMKERSRGMNATGYRELQKSVFAKYKVIINEIDNELKTIIPMKCTCGNNIDPGEEKCSKCGLTRQEILKNAQKESVKSKKKIFIIIAAIVVAVLVLAFIFGEKEPDVNETTSISTTANEIAEKATEPLTEPETEAKKADNNDSKADSSNETTEASTEKTNDVPKEYQNALKKAEIYSDTMNMSKSGIYNQLTSEYGEGFSEDAANYAVDHLDADYKANALAKAKNYQEIMAMSKSAIYDQLVSEYGEGFTEEEAQYAIDNLED